ncbi:hypothetical protein [Jannaschia pohangensis]|uniref:Uncharacterized protein n=1 Tax=Jannaschia pohangensis TaxID=390807 RepID=A0A1I3UFP8_9RHOB|nr:hypothetical protein [Jannaschia pohangensis]SFJ80696.1 hypothetical protein SAMN04488095_3718 [Jannaschia pohangensis]
MKFRVEIGVLAGTFASQQLAFAHLLDANPGADLEQVEVLARPFGPRLRGYFPDDTVAQLEQLTEPTLILLLPGSGVAPRDTRMLRFVGRYSGTLTRALLPDTE